MCSNFKPTVLLCPPKAGDNRKPLRAVDPERMRKILQETLANTQAVLSELQASRVVTQEMLDRPMGSLDPHSG